MLDVIRWILGGALLALGAHVASFGAVRIVLHARRRARGDDRRASGTPLVGPALFLAGWALSPLAWSPWALLVVAWDLDTLSLLLLPLLALRRPGTGRGERPERPSDGGDPGASGRGA